MLAAGHPPAPPVLRAAIEAHQTAVVERLLAAGADPNYHEPDRWPLLHQAALRGAAELVELLLAAGADPHAEAAGRNAREIAEQMGHVAVAELLPQRPLPARLVRQASAAARAAWLEMATWFP